jgi:hypothetical protein
MIAWASTDRPSLGASGGADGVHRVKRPRLPARAAGEQLQALDRHLVGRRVTDKGAELVLEPAHRGQRGSKAMTGMRRSVCRSYVA